MISDKLEFRGVKNTPDLQMCEIVSGVAVECGRDTKDSMESE
ncbi:MAG TPA: hypothetical protein VKA68_14360 [bacterium]|nr:hypothetical protein [bacterium]